MTSLERRAVAALAAIFALRMLGLFLVMPVLALHVHDLPDATPLLIGVALGAYGFTQALLQVPFGMCSDRIGRKRMIAVGLLIFAAGSAVAALADSAFEMIAGRALQGAGAIAAVVLALVADLTREQQRTKAMAVIGMSIGAMFMVALMLGPVLAGWLGVSGVFWLTLVLTLLALPVLWWVVPAPLESRDGLDGQLRWNQVRSVFRDPQLLRLNAGIAILHMSLTALFVAIPLALTHDAGIAIDTHWKIYVPVLGMSLLGMVPLLMVSRVRQRGALLVAVGVLLASQIALAVGGGTLVVVIGALWLFFIGFNSLEAMLPSLASRLAPTGTKGTVLGIYNTFQFLGVFVGGVFGGYLYGLRGSTGVFVMVAGVICVWLVLVISAPPLRLTESIQLTFDVRTPEAGRELAGRLQMLPGVVDVTVMPSEGMAYLNVDRRTFDNRALDDVAGMLGFSAETVNG